jgi:hypothetical protein
MTDRPEELELVELYLGTARNAHLRTFRVHRELVELDAADDTHANCSPTQPRSP